uniref:PGG domain-containing protein n=1 Tax=Aegilops tauschii subsp. strangulata TaxID=200361 RepID=A0A453ACD7_AEGTS
MQCKDLPASKIMQHIPSPPRPPQANQMATPNIDSISDTKLYELKEQLLLLTTLVATVTYVTGLNLPGGAWQTQQADGHGPLAGDPILRDIHYRRYLAFYYCNGTALASSVVVCLILVMLRRDSPAWSVVLRVVMVLDLLGLMGSYAAGTCHDTFATIWVVALAFPVLAYITYAFVCYLCLPLRRDNHTPRNTNTGYQEKEKIEVLMLLATFAVTISYAAGLNPPGGFWTSTGHKDGRLLHLAGDPIMEDSALRRYRAFFVCNTTAFVASLLIILLLLDKNLSRTISARFVAVYGFIGVALLGLMGAYAAGSCRETDNTIKVLSLAAGVPICVILQLALNYVFYWPIKNMCDSFTRWLQNLSPRGASALADPDLKNTRFFVMVLASFAVSITYQAGLDPPGGLWKDDLNGHKIGHPVLRTTHPARYQVFFYSNSAAFVTSLVVVMMVQSKFLLKRRTLVAAMVLDLIGLVIAYAAGSTRDASTSIYVVAVACLVLSYVVVHIALGGEKENVAAEPAPAAGTVAPDPATPAATSASPAATPT